MTQQSDRERLAEIDQILQSGITKTSNDGQSTEFNHDSLRRERAQLETRLGHRKRRPRVFGFNMGSR